MKKRTTEAQITSVSASAALELNAMSLVNFLERYGRALDLVYVQDSFGNVFTRVSLVKEKLTDGSIVNNLVLS